MRSSTKSIRRLGSRGSLAALRRRLRTFPSSMAPTISCCCTRSTTMWTLLSPTGRISRTRDDSGPSTDIIEVEPRPEGTRSTQWDTLKPKKAQKEANASWADQRPVEKDRRLVHSRQEKWPQGLETGDLTAVFSSRRHSASKFKGTSAHSDLRAVCQDFSRSKASWQKAQSFRCSSICSS